MKRALAAVCGASLLIICAHRLPAPISEEKPSPTEAPSKPKSSDSFDSSSISRFDGTWRATKSFKNRFGSTFSETKTIIIKNGTALYTRELTSRLPPGKKWSNFPAPYNSISPIYQKWIDKATEVKAEGSNIKSRWPGNRLVEWTPNTIPVTAFKNVVGQPNSTVSILSGEQLIVTSGKGAVTYTRVR